MENHQVLWVLQILVVSIVIHETKGGVLGDPISHGQHVCPGDSVCMDLQECRSKNLRHYVFPDGRPYLCGTQFQTQEWVCCEVRRKSDASEVLPGGGHYAYSTEPPSPRQNDDEDDIENGSDSGEETDGDVQQNPGRELPDLPQDRYDETGAYRDEDDNVIDFDTQDDPLAMPNLEELLRANEHYSSSKHDQRPNFQNQQRSGPQYGRHENENNFENQFDPLQPPDVFESHFGQAVREPRQNQHYQCRCDPGPPGPKGDPGEPGKIVYVPVFIPGPTVPSSTANVPPYLSVPQPQQVPYYQQPQYPNPSSFQYAYPSAPSIQPQSPYQPLDYPNQLQSPYQPLEYPNQPYQIPNPPEQYQPYPNNHPSHQSPTTVPYSNPYNSAGVIPTNHNSIGGIPQTYSIPSAPSQNVLPHPPQSQLINHPSYGTNTQRYRRHN